MMEEKLDEIIELLKQILGVPKYPIIYPCYPQYPNPYWQDQWITTHGSDTADGNAKYK